MKMDSKEIQKRVDEISQAMTAKGLREPNVQATIESNVQPHVYLKWKDVTAPAAAILNHEYKFIRAGSIIACLDEADKFVSDMPSADETRMKQFMGALANVIELGKDNGMDVAFINPLQATMKKLSENILTDQRAA
ncbi:hypothetical protein FHT87_005213 [Rhizobium sp. BK316]|uniref:hypothetical protein n=1 Tax=Rhizobium sp. BK316 TaxID=2587053 RepID=UPI00161B8C92|nr:hypothetical protein [Rhizobium sp. BK316]MBB3411260.1 hypothetical protein [Rhizobium sp. BK316]